MLTFVFKCLPCLQWPAANVKMSSVAVVKQWQQDENACPLCCFQGEYNEVTCEVGESTEPSDGEFSNLGGIQVENKPL